MTYEGKPFDALATPAWTLSERVIFLVFGAGERVLAAIPRPRSTPETGGGRGAEARGEGACGPPTPRV